MRWCSLLCLALLAVAGVTGCNNKGSAPAPVKIDIPKTPDGTVTAVTNAVADGKFEVIWQAMPESYQGKISHLLEEVAEHMDPAVYDKVMTVVGKVVKVLTDKQEFILGTDFVKQQIAAGKTTKEEVKESLSAFAGLLGDLHKDIKTTKELEKLNVEKYLANIGSRYKALEPILSKNEKMKFKLSDLKKTKVVAKEVTNDAAKLEITDPDGKTNPVDMVRVEGKWVPKDINDKLPKQLDEMGEMLHEKGNLSEKEKANIIAGASMVEGFLDTMLKASTQKEFDEAVALPLGMFGGGMMPQPQ